MSESLVQLFGKFGRTYAAHDTIFLENDKGAEMYIILSGKVQISKRVEVRKKIGNTWVREGAEEKKLATLGPGDFFGEMSLLNDKPRSAKAEVLEEAKVIVLNRQNFERILELQPKLTVKMLKGMSNRVRELDKLVGWQIPQSSPPPEEKESAGIPPQPAVQKDQEEKAKAHLPEPSTLHPVEHIDSFFLQATFPHLLLDSFSASLFEATQQELPVAEIAKKMQCADPKVLELLLQTLSGLGLLVHFEGTYGNLPLTNRSFTKEGNSSLTATLQLFQTILTQGIPAQRDFLQTGKPLLKEESAKELFTRNFFENFLLRYTEAVDFLFAKSEQNLKKFIEISPSPASYAIEIQRNCKAAEGILFDTPERAKEVENLLEVFDLRFQMTVHTADPYQAIYPQSQDLFLSSMQSFLQGEKFFSLVQKAKDALRSGGLLFVHDFFLDSSSVAPLRSLAMAWIFSLFVGPRLLPTLDEVKEKIALSGFQCLQEGFLSDQTACLLFQKP